MAISDHPLEPGTRRRRRGLPVRRPHARRAARYVALNHDVVNVKCKTQINHMYMYNVCMYIYIYTCIIDCIYLQCVHIYIYIYTHYTMYTYTPRFDVEVSWNF